MLQLLLPCIVRISVSFSPRLKLSSSPWPEPTGCSSLDILCPLIRSHSPRPCMTTSPRPQDPAHRPAAVGLVAGTGGSSGPIGALCCHHANYPFLPHSCISDPWSSSVLTSSPPHLPESSGRFPSDCHVGAHGGGHMPCVQGLPGRMRVNGR